MALLGVLAIAPSPSCAQFCTSRDGPSGFWIGIGATPADYLAEVEADGETLGLSFTHSGEQGYVCDPCWIRGERLQLVLDYSPYVAPDSDSNIFLISQYVVRQPDGTSTGPTSLRLRLWRDGVAIYDGELTATYETMFPNGSDCPPENELAVATIAVP